MTTERSLKAGRTFALCLIALFGLLGLSVLALLLKADSPLLLAAGAVVAVPLGAWIGGKGWASAMAVLGGFRKGGDE